MRKFARLICLSLFAFLLLSFLLSRHTSTKSWRSMTGDAWSSNTHLTAEQEVGHQPSDIDTEDYGMRGPPSYNSYSDEDTDTAASSSSPHGAYDAPSHRIDEDTGKLVIEEPADHATDDYSRPYGHFDNVATPHSPDRDSDLHDDLLRPFPDRPDSDNTFSSEEEKKIAAGLGLHPHPQSSVSQTATYIISPTTAGDAAQSAGATPLANEDGAEEDEDEEEDEEDGDDGYHMDTSVHGGGYHYPGDPARPAVSASASLEHVLAASLNVYTNSATRTSTQATSTVSTSAASETTDAYRETEDHSQQEQDFINFVHNMELMQSAEHSRVADLAAATGTSESSSEPTSGGSRYGEDDLRGDLFN